MIRGTITGLVLAALQPVTAPPVVPPPVIAPGEASDATTVEAVVVEGRRERTEAEQRRAESAFVRELAAPTRRDRLARWDRSVCVGVVGLPARHGTYIADRIAQESLAVGLDVGPPGCRPNALILYTSEAGKTAADLRRERAAFFTGGAGPMAGALEDGGGGQSMKSFLASTRPVRWWHVAALAAADGRPLSAMETPPGSGRFTPVIETTGSSRLASFFKESISRAVIIVDAAQVHGLTHEALASYLVMVTLAQLDPEAEPDGLDTIMNLFRERDAGRTPSETLSEWDRAYLKGLYASPDDARNVNSQRGAIRRSLKQTRQGG